MGVHQGLGNACESQAEIERAVQGRGVLEEPLSLAVPFFLVCFLTHDIGGFIGIKSF